MQGHLFADLLPSAIRYEDEDVIVVDKPAHVPSQAARPEDRDDLRTRLMSVLEARDGRPGYLGVHQRLDKETSGLLLFTRRKEANDSISRQFEGRQIQKTYVACVHGRPKAKKGRLTHFLAPRDGLSLVVPRGSKDAREAVLDYWVEEQRGDRARLRVSLHTGRMHQARAQLAAAGMPIAGDAAYGGAPALRLMLHARQLAFESPSSKEHIVVNAEEPLEISTFVDEGPWGDSVYDDDAKLERALTLSCERRHLLGRSSETTAFRLVNEAGDGLPELAVDVYGAFAVAQFYGTDGAFADPARRERVLSALHALGFEGVYQKIRPKQANIVVNTRTVELAPPVAVRGSSAPDPLVIVEEGVPYEVRLGDGLSTGIFLDQRRNRREVRNMAKGARVLNLFSYTCGFSVAAAVGGAKSTTSVDVSPAVLEWGGRNFEHAGRPAGDLVRADVLAWVDKELKAGKRYEIIVLDPPSYATTKTTRFSASEDYGKLAQKVMGLLAPGGRLFASTNLRKMRQGTFRKVLRNAAEGARRKVLQLKDAPEPVDYPVSIGHEVHLKAVWVTLA